MNMEKMVRQGVVAGIIISTLFGAPVFAAAQTSPASVQAVQVLPVGGTGCAAPQIQGVTAYIYEKALHSFDVVLADTTSVGLLAYVGSEGVPFNYISRFNHGGGGVRHHVDLHTTGLAMGVPISLVLLSQKAGVTCLTTVSFTVNASGTPSNASPATGTTSTPTSSPTTSGAQNTVPSQPEVTIAPTPEKEQASATTGIAARMQGLCTGDSALQLWLLLLAIYVVIAALTALARPPLAEKSVALPLVLILVPLVLLLSVWYFAPSCRAAGWVPAVSVIIAIAALLVAFREQESVGNVISLPAARPQPPMPAKPPALTVSQQQKAQQQPPQQKTK